MNFFHHKDLGNHLLQLCPKVVKHPVYVSMYVCMYVCMCVCTYVCMYVCAYVCMHVCMCVCMYVYMYVCVCVCTYVCMYANDIQKDDIRHNKPVSKCKLPRHCTRFCTFQTWRNEYQAVATILSATGVFLKATHNTVLVLNMNRNA